MSVARISAWRRKRREAEAPPGFRAVRVGGFAPAAGGPMARMQDGIEIISPAGVSASLLMFIFEEIGRQRSDGFRLFDWRGRGGPAIMSCVLRKIWHRKKLRIWEVWNLRVSAFPPSKVSVASTSLVVVALFLMEAQDRDGQPGTHMPEQAMSVSLALSTRTCPPCCADETTGLTAHVISHTEGA